MKRDAYHKNIIAMVMIKLILFDFTCMVLKGQMKVVVFFDNIKFI